MCPRLCAHRQRRVIRIVCSWGVVWWSEVLTREHYGTQHRRPLSTLMRELNACKKRKEHLFFPKIFHSLGLVLNATLFFHRSVHKILLSSTCKLVSLKTQCGIWFEVDHTVRYCNIAMDRQWLTELAHHGLCDLVKVETCWSTIVDHVPNKRQW